MNKIIYASFIRYPAEKAHALYVAKSCEAFASVGMDVSLVVPRRFGIDERDHREVYRPKNVFTLQRLWCIDLLWLPVLKAIAHKIGLLTFGLSVFRYTRRHGDDETVFLTNDVWLALMASYTRVKVVYELHDYPTGQWWLYRWAAKRVNKIQTNNQLKVAMVVKNTRVSAENVYAVHNGVTIEDFDIPVSQEEARSKLGLTMDKTYAVYTGHLYDWKGARVLAEAALHVPEVDIVFVGGTPDDVNRFKQNYATIPNLHFLGHHPHQDIPYYLKAADVLVLPNSGQSELSLYHTSPMKLFEYMASGRPIVASDLPALREVVGEAEVFFVAPDDAAALATKIKEVIGDTSGGDRHAEAALKLVQQYDWNDRARIILSHCNEKTSSK